MNIKFMAITTGLLSTTVTVPAAILANQIFYGMHLGYNQDIINYQLNDIDSINYANNNTDIGVIAGANITTTPSYALDVSLEHFLNNNKSSFLENSVNKFKFTQKPTTIIDATITIPWQPSLNLFTKAGYRFTHANITNTVTNTKKQGKNNGAIWGIGIDLHSSKEWSYRFEMTHAKSTKGSNNWQTYSNTSNFEIMHNFAPQTKIAKLYSHHPGYIYPIIGIDYSATTFAKHSTRDGTKQTNLYGAHPRRIKTGLGWVSPNYHNLRVGLQTTWSQHKQFDTLTDVYAPVEFNKKIDRTVTLIPELMINENVKLFGMLGRHNADWQMKYSTLTMNTKSHANSYGLGFEVNYNRKLSYRIGIESAKYQSFPAGVVGDPNSTFTPSEINSNISLAYRV